MKRYKAIIYSFAFIIALYAIIVSMLYLFQEYLIFLPQETAKDHAYTFEEPFEEHFLVHENGDSINSLHFFSPDNEKGLVIYFHGNSKSLSFWGSLSRTFTDRGHNVLMIDYRGYGKSDGEPSEQHLFEDGLLVYEWALSKYQSEDIIVYGRSLGSSVACHVASQKAIKALILESPLSSIEDVVDFKYPFLFMPSVLENNFSNESMLSEVKCPIHIIHGTKDEVIPLESMIVLKDFLTEEDSFTIVEGGGHNDLSTFADFHQELDRLLK